MDIPQLVAAWLHVVAFAIAWGYYGVLARIVVPSLERTLPVPDWASSVAAIERRALPLLGISLVLLVVTGVWLLVIAPQYAGLGNVFANTWSVLMLVKHVAVAAFVVLAVLVDRSARRLATAPDDAARRSTIATLARLAEVATGTGAVIALLTVAAQLV